MAGRNYDRFTDEEREAVIAAYPRSHDFGHQVLEAFYQGLKHRPQSTFGSTMIFSHLKSLIFSAETSAASF